MESCLARLAIILALYNVQGVQTQFPVISPSPNVQVTQGDNLTVTCTYDETITTLTQLKWILGKKEIQYTNNCTTFSAIKHLSTCLYFAGNTSYFLQLTLTTSEYKHNDSISCAVTDQSGIKPPASTQVYVEVPVKLANLTLPTSSTITIEEGLSLELRCSSEGRPRPTIDWYKQKDAEPELPIPGGNNSPTSELGTESVLIFIPNRTDNGYIVYCKAYNVVPLVPVFPSNKLLLDVLYKPGPLILNHKNESTYSIIENTAQTLTCKITGGNPIAILSWNCFNGTEKASHNGDVSSTISWTAERKSDGRCECRSQHVLGNVTIGLNVNVLYPPSYPTISYTTINDYEGILREIKIIEGSNATFTCSSDSNPPPSYYWSPGESGEGQTLVIVDIGKDVNKINCTATNNMVPTDAAPQNGTNTSSTYIDVLYKPTPPTLTFFTETSHKITTNTIGVISGDSFSIGCQADGNPLPVYHWDNSPQANSNISIEAILTDGSQMHTCIASNVMYPTDGVNVTASTTANVSFNVMHMPSLPNLYYAHGYMWELILNSTIRVIEHTSFTVKCDDVVSNPPDVTYHWQGIVAQNYTIHGINRNQSREYTCNVTNEMNRTFGVQEIGNQSTLMTVDVLYPPRIQNLVDIQIEEGNTLNVTCDITKGNPDNTTFRWSVGQTSVSSAATLEILNVTRNLSALYTCLVYNTLEPTFGTMENGSDFKSFYIGVLYKSAIEKFYADGYKYSNITIDENDDINLHCFVDSNPNSYIDISLDEQQVAVTANSKHLNYSIESAACDDAGVYTCTGYNPHIQDQTKESTDIRLYVLCSPRASKPVNNITLKAQNTTVHFNATFVAYPVPRYEDYFWRKQQPDTSWVALNTTDRIFITSTGLQTDLTINNIQRSDYTNYSLTVSNNVGKDYGQIFWLIPHEAPEKPENVNVKVLETNEVFISWNHGFNGGFEQTFVIQLSNDEINWYNKTFEERRNDSRQQSWTILKDIELDKTYYIRLFSFNDIGRSDIVADPELVFFLKSAESQQTSSTNIAGIVGGTFGGVAAIAITIVAVVFYRRKSISKTGKGFDACICCCKHPSRNVATTNVYVNVGFNANTDANPRSSLLMEMTDTQARTENRKKEELDHVHSVCISDVRALSMSVRQNPKKLEVQFKGFKPGKQFSTNAADKPSNKAKNRYKEMHPYDKNRIVLPLVKGNPNSDYMNASLIKGYGQKKYIASQAALENTLPDYWRMIWTQNVTQIVMLTNCVEHSRLKCYQYWPDNETNVYGSVSVRHVSEDAFSEYTIRVFDCSMVGSQSSKTLTQYHFTAWPDKDVPDTCVSLVQLWKIVKDGTKDASSPLMVHCSAGVGRTGTFLALDYLYDQGKAEGFVNFEQCVVQLREQRMTMVQTMDQYAFLHHAVLEALDPIVEVCKKETFRELKQRLLNLAAGSSETQLKLEYMMIEAECHVEIIPTVCDDDKIFDTIPKRDEFRDSKLPQNKDKSRDKDILPSDIYRPVLEMVVPGCGDYINAVVLSTYRFIDRMIVTQVPLSNTIIDFLRMVWDFDVSTVILMENDIPKNDMYWSSLGKCSFGIFDAEVVKETVETSFVKRVVRYAVVESTGRVEQKDVLILQFTAWHEDNLPDPKSMTSIIAELERKHVMTDPDAPFVVQCMDGASKSGLFCVLWSVLERMKFEREVAISETVRFLRTRRKQIIRNFDQYQYCYDLVQQYLDEFEVYNNVV